MEEQQNLVMSYHRMRRWVGYLGIGLPFALIIGNWLFHELKIYQNDTLMSMVTEGYAPNEIFKGSISEYYYSPMGELFVGTLCAVAFFLFLYKGYDSKPGENMPSDSMMTNIAGCFALLVAIFPMDYEGTISENFRTFCSHSLVGNIHYISAFFFFLTLALICIVNFRRTKDNIDFGKKPSHDYYKWCGIGILVSIVLIAAFKFITPLKEWANDIHFHYLFWFETSSLLFFGASWLKKGQISSN